jgi:hypothetical protein
LGEVEGGDQLRSAVSVEEAVKALHPFVDRGRGETELHRDLSVGEALGDGPGDSPLPIGERRAAVNAEKRAAQTVRQ